MDLWHDVRFAARLLVKDRWFTLAAATALALGIGANTAVFTFVNAVLIRGLPFEDGDRIMAVWTEDTRGRQMGVSYADFEDWRAQSRTVSDLTAFLTSSANVSDDIQAPEQVTCAYVTHSLFRLIGQQPILGRDFREDDDRPGAEPVVILGHALWQNRYEGDPAVIGRAIKTNTRAVTVIGVMPPDMKFPNNVDLWVPRVQLPPETLDGRRQTRNFAVLGRLAGSSTIEQARVDLRAIGQRLAQEYPDTNKDFAPNLSPFVERVNGGPIRLVFLSLMGAVAFVLLIACANVANLLLARSARRATEISVRISLGAGRWRVVRQLLVESVLLALIAGVIGFGLAVAGIRWFDSVTEDVGKPYWMVFTMDGAVFAFMAVVCLATGIVFGLAPALHASKTDTSEALKEGGRFGTGGLRARRWTSALIVTEVVLTLVLLAGAGFMMRSFLTLYRMDLGIETSQLLTMRFRMPVTRYPQPGPRTELLQRFEERLSGVAAIQASALTSNPPLGGGLGRRLVVDGRPGLEGEARPTVTTLTISDGYFDALGVRLLRGRAFDRSDGLPGREAVIVNQRFVAMHFATEDPLGRRIQLVTEAAEGPAPAWATIVGVVPDIRQRPPLAPEQTQDPVVYLPYRAAPPQVAVLIVRTPGNPADVAPLVRETMRVIEPDLPLFQIETMDQFLAQQRWPFRVFGSMFAIFAVVALVLSAGGLYAVTAYSVTQRTQEIGLRVALGARPIQITWLVLRRALVHLAIGLPIGLAGAYGVGRLLQSLLIQTGPGDPATLISIVVVLVIVAVLSCLWPARRAARLDPMLALRYE